MISKGKHKVTIVDSGIQEDRNGQAQPFLKFKTDSGDEITWFGNLKSEASTDFTVKALVTAGFFGNDLEDLKKPYQLIFEPHDLTITVEIENYNNKDRAKVKFINRANQRTEFRGQAPKMASVFAKYKSELGVKSKVEEEFPF